MVAIMAIRLGLCWNIAGGGSLEHSSMILIPSVRLATPADARDIADMSRRYIEHGLGWSWTPERVLKGIEDTSTNVAVLHQRESVLGFGIMQYGEETAHLALLAVDHDRRNQGLGSLVLGWLEQCATVAGIERIRLEARVDNAAGLAFYARHGYRQTGTLAGYYLGVVDAARLEKSLRPEPGGAPG
jgi:[ribosomal protein S18]-alanine N-acetyltransferase